MVRDVSRSRVLLKMELFNSGLDQTDSSWPDQELGEQPITSLLELIRPIFLWKILRWFCWFQLKSYSWIKIRLLIFEEFHLLICHHCEVWRLIDIFVNSQIKIKIRITILNDGWCLANNIKMLRSLNNNDWVNKHKIDLMVQNIFNHRLKNN